MLLNISIDFVCEVRITSVSALVHKMAWRRPGDKPLSEPMMVSLLTLICVTRPQWVQQNNAKEKTICGTKHNHLSPIISCLDYDAFLSISAGAVAAEGYHVWSLAIDVGPISDNSPLTCANLTPSTGSGLLIMNTSDFTELRVRLFTTNLAATVTHCQSIPLILLMNVGAKSMGSDDCRPLCGPPATCNLEETFDEFIVWHCVCPGGSSNQIALAVSSGAFIDKAMPAKICNVDLIYTWNVFKRHLGPLS